jgi:hypothetical protein
MPASSNAGKDGSATGLEVDVVDPTREVSAQHAEPQHACAWRSPGCITASALLALHAVLVQRHAKHVHILQDESECWAAIYDTLTSLLFVVGVAERSAGAGACAAGRRPPPCQRQRQRQRWLR